MEVSPGDQCHGCGETGYYVECKDSKSATEPAKVVLKEVIGLITANEDPVTSKWYLGSKCTVHVCNSRDMFVDYQPWTGHEVVLDNNKHVDVAGIGTVVLRFTTGKALTLSNVFHIPTISKCLVSLFKLAEFGCKISSVDGVLVIKKNQEIIGKGYHEDGPDGLYRLSISEDIKSGTATARVVHEEVIGLITEEEHPFITQMRRRGWYLLTRCTVHVCNSRDMFAEYKPWTNHEVVLESNERANVAGIGTVVLRLTTGKFLTLSNVFHIPLMRKCLISVGKLCDIGFNVRFGPEETIIYKRIDKEIVGKGYEEGGLFRLSITEDEKHNTQPNIKIVSDYLNKVVLGNNERADVTWSGTAVLRLSTGKALTLSNVLHVPGLRNNLLSVSKLCELGFSMDFGAEGMSIYDKNLKMVGKGSCEGGMFQLSLME